MSIRPIVSVIIPCYNSEKTLQKTIESVLAQTYRPIEVIVVDDGSSDSSIDIAASFDSPVTVIAKKNGGPASARNRGIRECKGDYIAFLDADDLWLPDKLDKQIAFARKAAGPILVFTAVQRVCEDGSIGYKSFKEYIDIPIDYRTLWDRNIITTSSVLAHAALFDEYLFDEDPLVQGAEDFDLWLRISDNYTIHYIDALLTTYIVSEQGHNRSNLERTFNALIHMYHKHTRMAAQHGVSEQITASKIAYLKKICGIRLFRVGSYAAAKEYLSCARKHQVWDATILLYTILIFLPHSWIVFLRTIVRWRHEE